MGWLLGKKENSEVPHGLSVIITKKYKLIVFRGNLRFWDPWPMRQNFFFWAYEPSLFYPGVFNFKPVFYSIITESPWGTSEFSFFPNNHLIFSNSARHIFLWWAVRSRSNLTQDESNLKRGISFFLFAFTPFKHKQ